MQTTDRILFTKVIGFIVCFLNDIFHHLNQLNMELQGRGKSGGCLGGWVCHHAYEPQATAEGSRHGFGGLRSPPRGSAAVDT